MGKTPRQRLTQLPMPTRSTEVSAECFGSVVLSYLRDDERKPASFFILGNALHTAIHNIIANDVNDPDNAERYVARELLLLMPPPGVDVLESSQRSMETIYDDARRMIHNWFTYVHPDSKKRHPLYDELIWPPVSLEAPFHLTPRAAGTKYPVWGEVDAVFKVKRGWNFRIVDWKSGVKRPDSDFQLNFYRFGLDLPEADAHYHMLDRVRKPSIVVEADKYPGDAVIRNRIIKLERQKDQVIDGKMPAFRPDWYCDWCPVKHLCPAAAEGLDNRAANGEALREKINAVEPMLEITHVQP